MGFVLTAFVRLLEGYIAQDHVGDIRALRDGDED